jgi:hypothetical protein
MVNKYPVSSDTGEEMSSAVRSDTTTTSTLKQLAMNAWATRVLDPDIGTNSKPVWGNALSAPYAPLYLELVEQNQQIAIQFGERFLIGRYGPNGGSAVDLDLSAFGGIEKGVSRIHATLYRVNHLIYIMDMGSANGTYLNGQRLNPYQERILRDGDVLYLGKLRFNVCF